MNYVESLAVRTDSRETAVDRRSVTDPIVALLVIVAAAASAFFGPRLLPDYSGNADEPVYVLQAQSLARGDLTLDGDLHDGPFRPWLTGEHDGRVFTQYQPGWPAALALGDKIGSMRLALVGSYAGVIVATAAVAAQVLGDRRVTRSAAALAAASPLFFIQSFTYLSYLFTTAWLLGATAVAIGALRDRHRGQAAVAGAMLSAGLLIRPFDALLTGGLWVLAALLTVPSGSWRRLGSTIAAMIAAGTPFVAATLAYNWMITGGVLSFPLAASSPRNRFGFGDREILPGEVPIDYSFSEAVGYLEANVSALPSWLPLGALGLLCLLVGLIDSRLSGRTRLALGLAVMAWPVAHFFWWATALSAAGALNGLGPHYYVPGLAVTGILIAIGAVRIVDYRPAGLSAPVAVALMVVAGCGLMAWNLTDKFDDLDGIRVANARSAELALPDTGLVLVPAEQSYLLVENPRLANEPRFGPVVFAVDDQRGNQRARLVAGVDSVYRAGNIWRIGDPLFEPSFGLVESRYVVASRWCASLPASRTGTLFMGWSRDLSDPSFTLPEISSAELEGDGELRVTYVDDEPSQEPGRALLRYRADDDDLTEVEVMTTIERGVTIDGQLIWLTSDDPTLVPVELTPC